jgi:hypothetical protein
MAAVRGGTLIGIPAPSVAESPDKSSEKPSDQPPATASEKPLHNASPVPPGKRTLIGIAAPVLGQKASPSEPVKAETASGSKPPPAASGSKPPPAASGSKPPPAEPARAEAPAQTPSPPETDEDDEKVSRAKSALASTRKETPKALAEARREARARASMPPSGEKSSRLGPILLFLVAAVAAAWFVITRQRGSEEAVNEPAANPQAEVAPQPEKPAEAPIPPPAVTTPTATAAPEPQASAAPIPTISADDLPAEEPKGAKGKKAPPASSAAEAPSEAAPSAAAPSAAGARVVTVHLMPPDAQLFYKGKSVGKTPVRVELGPDEKRRSFEVGRPGYVTRRLIVDGSQPEMWIGLRPESAAPTE